MKKMKGYRMLVAVEKEIGKKKFSMDLVIEMVKHHNMQYDIFKSKKPIMKHEVAIRAYNIKSDYHKALNIWGRYTTFPPLTPNAQPIPTNSDDVICFVVYDITFDELIRKIIQFHKLKAFL